MSSHLLGIIRMEQEGVEKTGVDGLMSRVQGAVFRQVTSRKVYRGRPGGAWRRVQRQVREPRSYSLFLRWINVSSSDPDRPVLLIWINEFDAGVITRVEPLLQGFRLAGGPLFELKD